MTYAFARNMDGSCDSGKIYVKSTICFFELASKLKINCVTFYIRTFFLEVWKTIRILSFGCASFSFSVFMKSNFWPWRLNLDLVNGEKFNKEKGKGNENYFRHSFKST